MINKRILSFIIFLLIVAAGKAQQFTVKSLDGEVNVIDVIPDYPNNTLTILSLKDTIRVSEFTGIVGKITVLNECFLEIVYSVRSGSDEGLCNLLLLCVDKKKLYQSIHITSFSTFDVDKVYDKTADSLKLFDEHGRYQLKVNVLGNNKQNYQLSVNIHDEIESKHDPKTNHNYNKHVNLNFDSGQCVFSNGSENISEYFTVYDPKYQKTNKRYILGTFPTVKLEDTEYYFIKGVWYGKGETNDLFKYSFK